MTGGQEPKTVVVGIIDDGIAFAHERFRDGGKSRVEFFWMQDGVYGGPGTNVDYGRELNKGEIKQLFADHTRAGMVDEDQLYVDAGLVDFRRRGHKAATWRIAHGTHVMDLACGFGQRDELRKHCPIVCVQLPARTTANTSGGDLAAYAADALWYIRDRADEIGNELGQHPLSVVVNFSYGMTGGPHDGTSALELLIDDLIDERMRLHDVPLAVVLPAGNSHLSRCHARISFRSTQPEDNIAELHWRVLPDDHTPSFLDIWLPHRKAGQNGDRLTVTVTPPGGSESTPPLGETPNSMRKLMANGKVLCALQYNHFPEPTDRGRFRVTLRPSAALKPQSAIASAGTWTVTLRNAQLERDELVQAWVQRDDSLYGYPRRGRQSYFDEKTYVRFDHAGRDEETDDAACPVKREGLLNAIASGTSAIVVGGFLRKEGAAAKYSAGGPISVSKVPPQELRDGPNAMAVSEDSVVHRGVLAAGSRSGSVVAMGGTSVAAPQITRWLVEQLARGNMEEGEAAFGAARDEVRDAVKQEAIDQEAARPVDRTPPTPTRGGHGRIETSLIVRLPRYWK